MLFDGWSWLMTWLCIQTITAAILVLVYIFVLIKVKTNYFMITKILVLMLVQNLATLALVFIYWQMYEYAKNDGAFNLNINIINWIGCAAFIIQNVCFVTAHWIFALEYYKISHSMPYVIKEEEVPEGLVRKIDRHNKVMISSIVILFGVGGVTRTLKNLCHPKPNCDKNNFMDFFRMTIICVVYVLAIIVGVYLFVAVYKIKNFLVK